MSTFRCRMCGVTTSDPPEHMLYAHDYTPSTMTQVWEQFALVASDHYRQRPRREIDTEQQVPTEPLF